MNNMVKEKAKATADFLDTMVKIADKYNEDRDECLQNAARVVMEMTFSDTFKDYETREDKNNE